MIYEHVAKEIVGASGKHYLFFYHPNCYFKALIRTNMGWVPTEMKAAAIDCGVPEQQENTHWFGEKLFPEIFPQPRRTADAVSAVQDA